MKKVNWIVSIIVIALFISACSSTKESGNQVDKDELTKVTLVLNWYPNTNHTGLYVAQEKGYFAAEGIEVEIVPPGITGSTAIVGAGEADFGVSIQENVTEARVQEVPVVSIAALMQHNTSVFASKKELNITRPKDFEGKVYGGFGSPAEPKILQALMEADGGDIEKVTMTNLGEADFFTAIERDVDIGWIFRGWDGIEAELRGVELNMIDLTEYSEKLDYYTPILITNEQTITKDPELVRSFVKATEAGYQFAIENPEEAAEILLVAAPELDEELVKASQQWISPHYKAEASQWGIQKEEVWSNYAQWMEEADLLEGTFDPTAAFTNEFLPE